jgi:hypothetical protein
VNPRAGHRLADGSGGDPAGGRPVSNLAPCRSGGRDDDVYRESIECLTRTRVRVEIARARLLYGEWLRREGRRVDAREQLRIAREMLLAMERSGASRSRT